MLIMLTPLEIQSFAVILSIITIIKLCLIVHLFNLSMFNYERVSRKGTNICCLLLTLIYVILLGRHTFEINTITDLITHSITDALILGCTEIVKELLTLYYLNRIS